MPAPATSRCSASCRARATLALGFGSSKEAAATLALSALAQRFDDAWQRHIDQWEQWHARCGTRAQVAHEVPATVRQQLSTSAMVLRAHQDKTYPGAMVASLSIPWGNTRDERGGYHLVWPRDLVECASALLALGGEAEARDVLRYLIATQHADGHWYQNQWLGGAPYWQGVQLDEAAFPVLLAPVTGGTRRPRRDRDHRHDAARARLHRAQRSVERPGPLGGGCRHQHVHPRRVHRGHGDRRAPARPGRARLRAGTG